MRQHQTYQRIHIDGFAEGPVPAEVYADVVGQGGAAFGRAAVFEDRVMALIDQIDGRQTGRIILQHLQHVGGRRNGILILPASLRNSVSGTWPARPADAYARDQPVQASGARGTGRGTSVILGLQIELGAGARCRFTGPPDAVLLHELVHAIRSITGTQQYIKMRSYTRFEEFVAVTITNVYLSEIHQPLREGHDGCDQMIPDVARFREIYGPVLARIDLDHTNAPLFNQLRALPTSVAPWNPFVRLLNIDLVDGDPDPVDPPMRAYQAALPQAIRATSLGGGINAILRRLGLYGRIGRLRILGHGNVGLQGVVHSRNPWVRGVIIRIAPNGQVRGQRTLGQLTAHFGAGGWVELHGCMVAADGGALIRALALLWQVPVKASLGLGRVGGGLEGPVSVAWPDGRLEQRSSDRHGDYPIGP